MLYQIEVQFDQSEEVIKQEVEKKLCYTFALRIVGSIQSKPRISKTSSSERGRNNLKSWRRVLNYGKLFVPVIQHACNNVTHNPVLSNFIPLHGQGVSVMKNAKKMDNN